MQRRTFIQLSAFTALALTLPLSEGCSSSTENIVSQPLLFSLLADKKTISEAGLAYRKQFPKEDNKSLLGKLLTGNNNSQDKSMVQKQLDERILRDFKENKVVTAAGWILSLTEARQCALYSILNA